MIRVLFICTHNSARSQMAEAWVNNDLAGRIEAFSAGTEPSGVHPLAIAVMKEAGIDISHQRSKGLEEFSGRQFDYLITLCDEANAACPIFFGGGERAHISLADPAEATGSEEEKLAFFRTVRDQIREKVIGYLESQEGKDQT